MWCFGVGDGYTRQMGSSTAAVAMVPKIWATLSSWRHERPLKTGLSSQWIRWFLPPLGTETKNRDIYGLLPHNRYLVVLNVGLRRSLKTPEMMSKQKSHNSWSWTKLFVFTLFCQYPSAHIWVRSTAYLVVVIIEGPFVRKFQIIQTCLVGAISCASRFSTYVFKICEC